MHYYDSVTYKNTIKSSNDGDEKGWYHANYNYLYAGNAYQWWMLPAGSRKMSNGNQAYHNTDQYSYCAILNTSNPANECVHPHYLYWLRSYIISKNVYFATYDSDWGPYYISYLACMRSDATSGVVVSFSF